MQENRDGKMNKIILLLIFVFLIIINVNTLMGLIEINLQFSNLSSNGDTDPVVYNRSLAIDRNNETCWINTPLSDNWLLIDLSLPWTVEQVATYGSLGAEGQWLKNHTFQYSDDNSSWNTVYKLENDAPNFFSNVSVDVGAHRYWRFYRNRRNFDTETYGLICELWFYGLPVLGPPSNLTFNYTNSNMVSGENSEVWSDVGGNAIINITSNDSSFTFSTDINSNCTVVIDKDYNYTAAIAYNADSKLATTVTTDHSMTAYFETITPGLHNFYVGCINEAGFEPPNSSSGPLAIYYYKKPELKLNTPTNNSRQSSQKINYTFDITIYSTVESCNLITNYTGEWMNNLSNSTPLTNQTTNGFFWNSTKEGYFLWNYNCTLTKDTIQIQNVSNNTVLIDQIFIKGFVKDSRGFEI